MNAGGIDVSKGYSTVCVMRSFGEIVVSPFEVKHTVSELCDLAKSLKSLNDETKMIMECSGNYQLPIVTALHSAELFVSAVNSLLINKLGNDIIRNREPGPADSIKIANYGLSAGVKLPKHVSEEEVCKSLKSFRANTTRTTKLRLYLRIT